MTSADTFGRLRKYNLWKRQIWDAFACSAPSPPVATGGLNAWKLEDSPEDRSEDRLEDSPEDRLEDRTEEKIRKSCGGPEEDSRMFPCMF
ncbi:hypothetical protein niasHT_030125 [Heterodera trifolii]|uniref:Uncharacterized protein n=1 Tax=Heterodera trifolii TaxID=157864 RepID=A0ABD2KLY3_9BILA